MSKRSNIKVSIAVLITFGLLFSTVPLVNSADIPTNNDPVLEVEHKINGVNLRSWVFDAYEGKYFINENEPSNWQFKTEVSRFANVHFKIVVKNVASQTAELGEFTQKLPANFKEISNTKVSINDGQILRPGGTFNDIFEINEEALSGAIWNDVTNGFSRIVISTKNYFDDVAEINAGGSFVVEFDALASDIISNSWSASAIADGASLFAPFSRNEVHVRQGTNIVVGAIGSNSYSVVNVKPNFALNKKTYDSGLDKYVEVAKAELDSEIEFIIDFNAPIAREGHPEDREYYFKELKINDYLPDELEFISCEVEIQGQYVGSTEPTIEKTEKGNVLKWIFMGMILSGHISIKVQAKQACISKNLVNLQGKVTSDSLIFHYQGILIEPSVDYFDDNSAFVAASGEALLSIEKLVYDEVNDEYVEEIIADEGQKLTFIINITNNGDYQINNLIATDFLSDIFVETGETSWEIGTLEVGESWLMEYTANIKDPIGGEEPFVQGENIIVAEGTFTYQTISPIAYAEGQDPIIIEEQEFIGQEAKVNIYIEGVNSVVTFSNPDPTNGCNDVYVGIPHVSVTIEDPDGDAFDWVIKIAKYDGEGPIDVEKIPDEDFIAYASGNGEFNGTKICPVTGLEELSGYLWCVIATDVGTTIQKREVYTFKTSNQPINLTPEINTETPLDGETDVCLCTSELTVNIEDPEEDLFDWTITTEPDIGSASGTAESGGIKTCAINPDLLQPLTVYTWTVEATDQGSGYSSTQIYTFRTEKLNLPPNKPSEPYPYDGQNFLEPFVTLEVLVSDPNDDDLDVTFYDGDDNVLGIDSGISSGDKAYLLLEGLNYATTYYWYAVASDGSLTNRSPTWSFMTEEDPYPDNVAPDQPTNPSPENGAEDVSTSPTLSVNVSDFNGDIMDVSFYDGEDNLLGVDEDVENGTTAYFNWLDLENETKYYWYAVANDGKNGVTTSEVFNFTTGGGLEPEILLVKPLEGMIYLNNNEICPFPTTLIIGAVDINITITMPVETIKLFIEGEEVATFEYNPLQPTYDYHWDNRSFFWQTIKIVALNGETEVTSYEMDVLAFIF